MAAEFKSLLDQTIERRSVIAKEIARLLAESRATCSELDDIFECVKRHLEVVVKD